MADETLMPTLDAATLSPPKLTTEETAAAKEAKEASDRAAAEIKKAEDVKKAAIAKAKSAHVVAFVGGVPKAGIHAAVGNDGVKISREGSLTIGLITTTNPGLSAGCIARLPDKSEIGDVVEVYVIPEEGSAWAQGAGIFPPKGESIGGLPISTGDNIGTGVSVQAEYGKSFRKVSPTNWQVLGA